MGRFKTPSLVIYQLLIYLNPNNLQNSTYPTVLVYMKTAAVKIEVVILSKIYFANKIMYIYISIHEGKEGIIEGKLKCNIFI